MFNIGWSELMVIGVVALIVVGPKDLPGLLRTVGKTVSGLRRMAGDFQRQFDDAIRESELDEVRKQAKSAFQPLESARQSALDFQKGLGADVRKATEQPEWMKRIGGQSASTPVPLPAEPQAPAAPASSPDADGGQVPPQPVEATGSPSIGTVSPAPATTVAATPAPPPPAEKVERAVEGAERSS